MILRYPNDEKLCSSGEEMTAMVLNEPSRHGWKRYVIDTFLVSPCLCIVFILMIFDVVGTTVGMMTDHAIITGCLHG